MGKMDLQGIVKENIIHNLFVVTALHWNIQCILFPPFLFEWSNWNSYGLVLLVLSAFFAQTILMKTPWKIGMLILIFCNFLICNFWNFNGSVFGLLMIAQCYLFIKIIIQEPIKINLLLMITISVVTIYVPLWVLVLFLLLSFYCFEGQTKFIEGHLDEALITGKEAFILLFLGLTVITFQVIVRLTMLNHIKHFYWIFAFAFLLFILVKKQWKLIIKDKHLQLWIAWMNWLLLYLVLMLHSFIPIKYYYLYQMILMILLSIALIHGIFFWKYYRTIQYSNKLLKWFFLLSLFLSLWLKELLIVPLGLFTLLITRKPSKISESQTTKEQRVLSLKQCNRMLVLNKTHELSQFSLELVWNLCEIQSCLISIVQKELNLALWQQIKNFEERVCPSNKINYDQCKFRMELIQKQKGFKSFQQRLIKSAVFFEQVFFNRRKAPFDFKDLNFENDSDLLDEEGFKLFMLAIAKGRKIKFSEGLIHNLQHRLNFLIHILYTDNNAVVEKEFTALKALIYLYIQQLVKTGDKDMLDRLPISAQKLDEAYTQLNADLEVYQKLKVYFIHLKPSEIIQKTRFDLPYLKGWSTVNFYLSQYDQHLWLDIPGDKELSRAILKQKIWFYPFFKHEINLQTSLESSIEFRSDKMPAILLVEGELFYSNNDLEQQLSAGEVLDPNQYLPHQKVEIFFKGRCAFAFIERKQWSYYGYLFDV